MKTFLKCTALASSLLLAACSTNKGSFDYGNFQQAKPRSILVLMPTDNTNEVKAGPAVLAHATRPLAEAGYYVFPSALVNETFKHNGLTQAQEIQNVNPQKLQQIFGADAALYINVENYGVQYQILDSVTKVEVQGKLVDLRTGKELWSGKGYADSNDASNANVNSGNPIVTLIAAAVKHIVNEVSDQGYKVAAFADARLLGSGYNGGLLYGPYNPKYGNDPQLRK